MSNLNAETLGRLGSLKLRARALMEGVLSGLHQSPHHGQSVEFAEHKEYSPGDDLRHLDWKAFGKFDRNYIKRFDHETSLRANLVVDASGSMRFSSGTISKLEVAKTLAATLAYILTRQRDAVGLTLLSDDASREFPPRATGNHLALLLNELESADGAKGMKLASVAQELAEKLPRRSLVCVFSDLFDDDEGALARLVSLRARRHDLVVFHILDPAELTFPWDDPTLFLSFEDTQRIEANARELRESYLQELNAFLTTTRATCARANCHYEFVRTDEPLDAVLLRFISARSSRR